MRILSVVGTRPQLIKAAALMPALRERHDEVFVDTGQHWDEAMAGSFFAELGLSEPDHSLGIGAGGHGDQVGRMLVALEPILVLGLTYRDGVKELAYSRALPLIERLSFHGAEVWAYDPLLDTEDIERCCAKPYVWGQPAPFRAIVTQTADKLWTQIDFSLFSKLDVVLDGRNSLRGVDLPERVRYVGIGVQAATRRRQASAPAATR